jgi:Ca-activated chloride channel family protein
MRKVTNTGREDPVQKSQIYESAMPLGFVNPLAFWIMLGVPFVLAAVLWGLRRREAILREFGRMDLLIQFSRFSLGFNPLYQVLPAALCFCLLVVSVARPILRGNSKEIMKGTLDVVAVLDVSKSMSAEDCGPGDSRLEMAKTTLLQSLPDLAGNRLGLVTFAGKSFPQAELTDDLQALEFVLKNWVTVDSAPSQGSNIGMALSEAIHLFEEDKRKRVILFFSDGGHVRPENLEGILTEIGEKGITVVSVGVGSKEGAKIPVYYGEGRVKEWLKIDGHEVETSLNEDILRDISQGPGGKYIHLMSTKELKGVLRNPVVMGKKALSGGKEIFQIPLGLAIGIYFLGIYLERHRATPPKFNSRHRG